MSAQQSLILDSADISESPNTPDDPVRITETGALDTPLAPGLDDSHEVLVLPERPELPVPEVDTPAQLPDAAIEAAPPHDADAGEEPSVMAATASGGESTSESKGMSNTRSFIADQLLVSPLDGSLTFSFPLKLPPGRAKMTPELALRYSSNHTSDLDIFGYGWSLDIPYIKRLAKVGTEQLYASNGHFYSSLSNELVPSASSTYLPKVETGEMLRYELGTNDIWMAYDTRGTRYSFGGNATARQSDPSDSARVAQWMLTEIRDVHDNVISFTYVQDSGQVYPDVITYTNNGASTGLHQVSFVRELRPSSLRSYAFGFPVENKYRVSKIVISTSGSPVREYALAYRLANNNARQLLSTVTEKSYATDNTSITLPPTTFSYASSTLAWSQDPTLSLPETFVRYNVYPAGTYLVDVNGDALPDIVRSYKEPGYPGNEYRGVYVNNGSAWTLDPSWTVPLVFLLGGQDQGIQMADVNGDGLVDILAKRTDHYGAVQLDKAYINTGSGWAEDSTWLSPVPFIINNVNDSSARLVDLNGDGLTDIVMNRTDHYDAAIVNTAYINTGSGWVEDPTWLLPYPIVRNNTNDSGARFADVNGDGLTDMVVHITDHYNAVIAKKAYINTGKGWIEDALWSTPVPFVRSNTNDSGARLADLNGDNLVDIGIFRTDHYGATLENSIYINNGKGWSLDPSRTLPVPFVESNVNDSGARIADIDGDGDPDIVQARKDHYDAFVANRVFRSLGAPSDVLTGVEVPQGGNTRISYVGSAKITDTHVSNPQLPISLQVVSSVTHDPLIGVQQRAEFEYRDGHFYFDPARPRDRKFASFGTLTKVTDSSLTTSYFHQGNGIQAARGESVDGEARIGQVYRTTTADLGGNLHSENYTRYSEVLTGSSTAVRPLHTVVRDFDGNVSHKDSARSFTYDVYGNILTDTQWGEVSAGSDGTYNDIGTDARITTYAYATPSDGRVRSAPQSVLLTDQSGVVYGETRTTYDGLPFGSVLKGNATKVERRVDVSTFAVTERSYNQYGLPTSEKDPRGYTTNISYDSANLFPASTTNALGHTTRYTYDYSSGKVLSTTDPNGKVFSTTYDALDRPLQEKMPDPQSGNEVVKATHSYVDTRGAVAQTHTQFLNDTTAKAVTEYFDGFGRKIQERNTTERPGIVAVRDIVYGTDGLVSKESLPYFGQNTSRTEPITSSDYLSRYTRDPLGRITRTTTAVGSTDVVFDNWAESVTDTENNTKDFHYDAYKRLTKVVEHNGLGTYTTTYSWNPRDQLTAVTDTRGNVRAITYDTLGRRTSIEDLHAPGDTTFGISTFGYDLTGNLTHKITPKAEQVLFSYDAINRPTTEDLVGTTATEVVYTYDSCTRGIGKVCAVANGTATTSYTYTHTGVAQSESRTISGTAFVASTTYDWQHNPIVATYPDSSEVRTTYNTANLPDRVEYKESGGVWVPLLSTIDYSPTGQTTLEVHSNNSTTTRTYDPLQLYRLTSLRTDARVIVPAENIATSYTGFSRGTFASTTVASSSLTLAEGFGASAWATTTLDQFTDVNGKNLELHVPTIGTGWQKVTGSASAILDINGNTLRPEKNVNDAGALYLVSPNPSSATYTIEWQNITQDTGATKAFHLVGHYIDANNFYVVTFYGSSAAQDVVLRKKVNGIVTVLGTSNVSVVPGDIYRFELAPNSQKVYRNGLLSITATDSTSALQGAGRAGVASGNIVSATDDMTTKQSWDNFKVSTLAPSVTFGPGSWTSPALTLGAIKDVASSSIAFTSTLPAGTNVVVKTAVTSSPTLPSASAFVTTANGASIPGIAARSDLTGKYLFVRAELSPSPDQKSRPTLNTLSLSVSGYATTRTEAVQNISYTYDSVGNITEMQTREPNGATSIHTYAYDKLYRLTSASSTGNSEGDYLRTYTYDPLGNITAASDLGAYAYSGHTGSLYANPHAVTSIASTTYSYDRSGNLVSTSAGIGHTWDYNNRLTQTQKGTTTVTYGYDHTGSRVRKASGAQTTLYPSKYYEVRGATTTKHIYLGDRLIVSVEKSGANAKTYHNYLDHLESTDLVIAQDGTLTEELEYYPFGAQLSDTGTGFKQPNQYIGQDYDPESQLSYLNARYYDGGRGQFVSEDPVFWEIGQSQDGAKALFDPQSQNSYSYARNNPMINKDPEGRYWETVFDVAMLAWSLSDYNENPSFLNGLGVVADGASLALPIPAVVGGIRHGDDFYHAVQIAQEVRKTSNWGGSAFSLADHTVRHAADFGLKRNDVAGYAKAAGNFISKADTGFKQGSSRYDSFAGVGDYKGKTYFFDKKSSTFGVRNADGSTATAYKPYGGDQKKASAYWDRQKKSKGGVK